MFQALYEYELVSAVGGANYRPRAYGELDSDGSWNGWLVFFPVESGETVIATPRETTQNTLAALLDWATGLTPASLEAALERALKLQANSAVGACVDESDRIEPGAATTTDVPDRAAAVAHRDAAIAAERQAGAVAELAAPMKRRGDDTSRIR